MINLTKLSITGAAALMLVGVSSAQVTKNGSGYLLRAKYVKGQTMKYLMTTKIPIGSTVMEDPIKMTVLDVNAKKEAKLSVSVGPQKMNGKASKAKPTVTTFSLDSRNQVVKGEKERGFENMASLSLPAGPVKVGQSWSTHTKAASQMGAPVDIKITYTFKGVKMVGGVSVAVVTTSFSGQIDQMGTLSGSGTTYLRASDGSLQNLAYTINMNLTMGKTNSGTISTKMDIVRK